ncbi:MAG: hypothetical protein ACRDF5_02450 [bacterium]
MSRPAVGFLLLLALAAGGCGGRGSSGASAPSATPDPTRIAVVDLDAVVRAHPRWPEVDAIAKKLLAVEAALAAPPAIPPILQAQVQARLKAQARRLGSDFQAEIAALKKRQEERMVLYAARAGAEAEAGLQKLRVEIDAELSRALRERISAARAELRQYELQVLDEYRFPIANLRLKADVVGVTSEEEQRQLIEELDRVLLERDAKVQARAEVLDATVADFQRAREAEATAKYERARAAARAETTRLVAAREREIQDETTRLGKAKEVEFRRRLAAFRRRLTGIGEGQVDAAERRFLEGLRQREQQLLAERQALTEQRLRLEDTILADVKIEVASIAAARGLDVVLTRLMANLTGEDLTKEVLARLKR